MTGHDFFQAAWAFRHLDEQEGEIVEGLMSDNTFISRQRYRHLGRSRQIKIRTFLEYAASRGVTDAPASLALIEEEA